VGCATEQLFYQIKRARCDHQVDCARYGFKFSNQSPLVIFLAFIQGIENEENFGVYLDFRPQCIYEVGESWMSLFVTKFFAECFDAFRSQGLILDDLLQNTRDKFLEALGKPFLIVTEYARYCDIFSLEQFPEMVYCDRPSYAKSTGLSHVYHLETYARNVFPAPAVIKYNRIQKCEVVGKRSLTNSRTPQNPRLPCEPVVKWLGLEQPFPGAFRPVLQDVSQPLPEVQTRQPVSNNMRPIIWASIFKFQHSMLVANAAYEVCSALYHSL